jgi:hypothetical protein
MFSLPITDMALSFVIDPVVVGACLTSSVDSIDVNAVFVIDLILLLGTCLSPLVDALNVPSDCDPRLDLCPFPDLNSETTPSRN